MSMFRRLANRLTGPTGGPQRPQGTQPTRTRSDREIHEAFRGLSPDEWLTVLQRSVTEPYIDGIEFPRFPSSEIQTGFNGAADEEAMLQAHALWVYAEAYARALGRPLSQQTFVLDVGSGWGRITRTFCRDVPRSNLYGVDIDPQAIHLARALGVPATFMQTEPGKPLPFGDGSFDVVVANSVFTHLPESVATQLAMEVGRVTKPGGIFVFTVEDDHFLNLLQQDGIEHYGTRWKLLSRYAAEAEALHEQFRRGEYIYLTTNEEDVRSSDVYGDAVIPLSWMEQTWGGTFNFLRYQTALAPLHQVVVVAVRRD